jgi:type IV pilus assembly protein PilE
LFPAFDLSSVALARASSRRLSFSEGKSMKFRQPDIILQCLTTPLRRMPVAPAAGPILAPGGRGMPGQRGVTLVELLIVMVIVAILSAIAYPSYQSHQRKGSRAAAQSLLMQVANRQAQYILDARNYAIGPGALVALNVSLPSDVAPYYAVTVENASGGTVPETPPSYTLRATPIPGTRQEQDGELRLTHEGDKSRAGNPGW